MVLTSQASGDASDTRSLGPEKLGVLFDLVMADSRLFLLEERLPCLSGAAKDLNEGMQMLKRAVQLSRVLTDGGHAMPRFNDRVHKARQGLNDLAAKRMSGDATRFRLPQATSGSGANGIAQSDVNLPSVVLPSQRQPTPVSSLGVGAARSRSANNLVGLPKFGQESGRPLTAKRLEKIISWVASDRWTGDLTPGDLTPQFGLGEIEAVLFATASKSIDDAASTFGAGDIAKLDGLVGTYKSVLENITDDVFRLSVERHSRETLVCWIAYAVVFAATRNTLWPQEMESFGVCLRAIDLQYLVLSDKIAVDAALKVTKA